MTDNFPAPPFVFPRPPRLLLCVSIQAFSCLSYTTKCKVMLSRWNRTWTHELHQRVVPRKLLLPTVRPLFHQNLVRFSVFWSLPSTSSMSNTAPMGSPGKVHFSAHPCFTTGSIHLPRVTVQYFTRRPSPPLFAATVAQLVTPQNSLATHRLVVALRQSGSWAGTHRFACTLFRAKAGCD